jgi:ankyrin repeat protein
MKINLMQIVFLMIFSCSAAQAIPSHEASHATELLLKASLHGDVQEIKKAIALGADVNGKNSQGDTPLNMVCRLSYFKLAKYFIDCGAEVNTANNEHITPLHYAVEYNNVKMVHMLLQHGANIDARDKINETPLHWAGWTGNIASAKLLLRFGANPYSKNNTGVTPLDLTVRQEHEKLERIFRKLKYQKLFGD